MSTVKTADAFIESVRIVMRLLYRFILWLRGYRRYPVTRADIDQTLFVFKRNLEECRRINRDFEQEFTKHK